MPHHQHGGGQSPHTSRMSVTQPLAVKGLGRLQRSALVHEQAIAPDPYKVDSALERLAHQLVCSQAGGQQAAHQHEPVLAVVIVREVDCSTRASKSDRRPVICTAQHIHLSAIFYESASSLSKTALLFRYSCTAEIDQHALDTLADTPCANWSKI